MDIENEINQIKSRLDALETALKVELSPILKKGNKTVEIKKSYVSVLNELKELLNSERWPEAVNPIFICADDSEEDKTARANGILEMFIDDPLNDTHFLDFGCGEGHMVYESAKNTKLSIGYDLEDFNWARHKKDNVVFLTNFDLVKQFKFDVILVYDVLDHITDNSQAQVLKNLKTLLTDKGKIYIRFHPWTSRTGSHLYKSINKAYAHLAFSDVDLMRMGYTQFPTVKSITPLETYRDWIAQAELTIKYEDVTKESCENFFFENTIIMESIKDNLKTFDVVAVNNIKRAMEIQFVDFVLA